MIKTTTPEAWEVAYKMADVGEYEFDKDGWERAGYPIYRAKESHYSRICDLGCRLEVVKADGTSTNIWIEPQEPAAEEPAHYGDALAEKIRETTTDFSKISHFDKFVLDRGYKYKTEGELKVAYDRAWRASHNILITLEDFLAETEKKPDEPAADTYAALARLVEEKKLQPRDVMEYDHFRWCLNRPEAVVAYQTERDKWTVNDCDTEITEEQAKVKVCEAWGFEASLVHIIGTPYYDATCRCMYRTLPCETAKTAQNGGYRKTAVHRRCSN